jgi:hypothetical protein
MNYDGKRITDAELWVLYILATERVSLKKIKDAVQATGSVDKASILAWLRKPALNASIQRVERIL